MTICSKCGKTVPAGFFRFIKKKDGTIVRPSTGKRCLVVPMCACWMK
jgi:hypothetical protein